MSYHRSTCSQNFGEVCDCQPKTDLGREYRVEAIEACISTVKAQIETAKACRYNDSYIAALRDILVSHQASLERVRRGEGYHPTTPLAEAVELCIICREKPTWPNSSLCASCGNEGG